MNRYTTFAQKFSLLSKTLQQNQEPSPRYAWMVNQTAFYTWVPHQQLAHCYEQLGDHKKAKKHQQK
ncbi:hypothetical protein COL93_26610 [Bacillus toyonensis]|uniref:Uncharacterized protein n=1 Tax=Bacillus toyonensis TaxID=155322 RepID=A0A2C4P883_9BACI|nr:hypothetical protein COL93_26610 [Bacillus toyonensis]PHD61255.1 hypothetical protein COF40_26650 [Bacillus toyonensis]